MPSFEVGDLSIPYDLRRSATARQVRLAMSADGLAVVAPDTADDGAIRLVLEAKRRWIVENHLRMRALETATHKVARFASGAKIPFRGRMARLHVERGDVSIVEVVHRHGFNVTTPLNLGEDMVDQEVELALRLWLRRKIREDAGTLVKRYASRFGVTPSGLHVKDLQHLWGSCGTDRSINLDWHLVFAPLTVLDYAVLHEVSHLKERNHGPAFWALVRSQMPDFESRMIWLQSNEHLLGYARLEAGSTPFNGG